MMVKLSVLALLLPKFFMDDQTYMAVATERTMSVASKSVMSDKENKPKKKGKKGNESRCVERMRMRSLSPSSRRRMMMRSKLHTIPSELELEEMEIISSLSDVPSDMPSDIPSETPTLSAESQIKIMPKAILRREGSHHRRTSSDQFVCGCINELALGSCDCPKQFEI
jgi:hypothetical protein